MIDATRITSHLWIGGAPTSGEDLRRHGFNVLVLCAEEYQPHGADFPGILVIHAPLDDHKPSPREIRIARHAALDIIDLVKKGAKVLVTCAMGRNRSGLVIALAMKRLMPGSSPVEIVEYIRSRRAESLTNPWFVELILKSERSSLSL